MSSFQSIQGFFVHNNPEEESQRSYVLRSVVVEQTRSLSCNSVQNARNSFGRLSQGYCERKPLSLEKTTSSVFFCVFINQCVVLTPYRVVYIVLIRLFQTFYTSKLIWLKFTSIKSCNILVLKKRKTNQKNTIELARILGHFCIYFLSMSKFGKV